MPQFEEEAASCRFFFRKENRVLRRADFQRIYSEGRPWRRPLLHAFVQPPVDNDVGGEVSPTRIGITVTKKAGNAVHRNRARRLVRESFRHCLPFLKPGFSIVVNVMKAGTTAPFAKVDAQLRDILRQAGVFEESRGEGASSNGNR